MHVRRTSSIFAAILGIGFGLCMPTSVALAGDKNDKNDLEQLTAQWWQWAFSIPTPQNPFLDPNGGNCVIGQRGSVWFLAGGTATRNCSVPEGATLFFPVINQVGYNSPNCQQGPENLSVKELRKATSDFINSVKLTDLHVELDGRAIYRFDRVQSDVFSLALPSDNIGGCPPGIYSPAVDDGYYVKLDPVKVGPHRLRIRVTAPFSLDVTYNLTIVSVLDK